MEKAIPKKGQEVLSLLVGGAILKFRRSPRGYFKLTVKNPIPWQRFHRKTLLYAIHSLYRQGLVAIDEGGDGTTTITLKPAGKRAGENLAAAPGPSGRPEWDRRWRLVLFDVPEEKRKSRETFRYHLQKLGFTEFQRSAFLYPYPCAREVDALAERLQIQEHIVMITAESVSNEFHFKKRFGLL